MRPNDRQLKITDIIRREGRVTVDQLVETFSSSPETIRRDLNVLAKSGKVQKVHGGAIFSNIHGEGSFQQRMTENIVAKRQIAEKASKLISPGDSLFIKTGSTTTVFAEELTKISNLTIVTNSLEIAKITGANKNGSKVFLLGGEYESDNRETLGSMVISQLNNFHVQHLIIPIGCINADIGVSDFSSSEVAVTRAMIEHAQNSIILADSTKFDRVAPFVIGPLNLFDKMVCEKEPNKLLKQSLEQNEVEIIC